MKLIHLSDLHLGKRVNELSMLPDQKHILQQIRTIIQEETPDAVLICGDIYDKSVPPAEAVSLFDDFLSRLAGQKMRTIIISGNHDSAERIAFGRQLMTSSGVYLSPVYDGTVSRVELLDEYGPVHVYLLPYIKPVHVRHFSKDPDCIVSYTDAMRAVLETVSLDPAARNVLLTHQFISGASRSDSEDISVGGLDSIDVCVFDDFDYVALGHLHAPQNIPGAPHVRYCGTPLKYSFSEIGHHKSVTVVEMKEKGKVTVRTVDLQPLHDMRELRGTYMELTDRRNYEGTAVNDYLRVCLTDEDDIPDAMIRLRTIYPNILELRYDNTRTRISAHIDVARAVERKSPLELFEELYEKQNNQPMSEEQREFVIQLLEELLEEDK